MELSTYFSLCIAFLYHCAFSLSLTPTAQFTAHCSPLTAHTALTVAASARAQSRRLEREASTAAKREGAMARRMAAALRAAAAADDKS